MNRAVARTGLTLVVATALTAWAMACGGGGEPEVAGPPNAECWRLENWPEIDRTMKYMPGQVIVAFKRDVTEAQAAAFIESYGLSFRRDMYPNDASVKVESGLAPSGGLPPLDEVMEELRRDELVKGVKPQCFWVDETQVDTGRCITINFNRFLTSDQVAAFVSSFAGLTLVEDFTPHLGTLVCVEPGRESDWIETFQAEDDVEYAEHNILGWLIE